VVNLTRVIIPTTMQEMNKFSNGKIYKVVSPNHPKVYYGSTPQTLADRWTHHTSPNQGCSSKEIIDAGDAEILEIEPFPCTCKEELEDREAEFIENDWDGCVNKAIPGAIRRAGGEKAYMKKRNHTPEAKAKRKAYAHTPEAKAKKQVWLQKPETKAMLYAYTQVPENKAKKLAHKAVQIPCNVCGSYVSRGNIARHQKTKLCKHHLKTELDKVMEDIISSIEISCN